MSTLLVENIKHEDATSNALTFDASGNVTIGTTNTNPVTNNVAGTSILAGGGTRISRSGEPGGYNRIGSDGTLINLRKDGATIGKIGTVSGKLVLGGGPSAGSDVIIDDNGNVGIGTDSPRNKLDVNLNANRSLNVRVSNDGSVAGTGVASIDPISGNMRDLVLEGEEVHIATGSFSGNSTTPRLSAYAAGGVKVHTNLDIGDKTRFIPDPSSPFDIELQTSDAGDGNFTKVLTIQSGDEFKFWGNGGADEIFRIDNTATYKSQTFGIHNAQGYYVNGRQTYPVVDIQRIQVGSESTTISTGNSWTQIGTSKTFTPKKAGNLVIVNHGVQTWYGTTSNGSGDILLRFLVDGVVVWDNERMTGNFDNDSTRQHLYINSMFQFTATSGNAHTITMEAYPSGSVPGGFNFYHVANDAANQYIFTEYET